MNVEIVPPEIAQTAVACTPGDGGAAMLMIGGSEYPAPDAFVMVDGQVRAESVGPMITVQVAPPIVEATAGADVYPLPELVTTAATGNPVGLMMR